MWWRTKNYMISKKVIIIISIAIFAISMYFLLYSNTRLKGLEKQVANIVLPENIEKIELKSKIGDSGGNGDYSTLRVVLVVKTEKSLSELKQEFDNMNLKFPNYYKNNNNIPIFYITHCESSLFKSSRDFSITFDKLEDIEDYNNYYFIEFVE